jgi:hypothetical protein
MSNSDSRRWAKLAVASCARTVWQNAWTPSATARSQPLLGDGVQLALLSDQGGPAAVQLLALVLEFGQADHLGQVDVQQPLLVALQLTQGLADGRLPGLELLGLNSARFLGQMSCLVDYAAALARAA